MKRKLFITLLASMLVSLLACSALASSIYFTGDCNVRTGPGLGYNKKGSVNRGSYLHYLEQSSVDYRGVRWYKVSFGGGSGWVSSVYGNITSNSGYATYGAGGSDNDLYYDDDGVYADDDGYSDYVYASSGDTHVRTGPGLGYGSLGVMYRGEGAVYLGKTRYDSRGVAWYSIRWDGVEAWVSSRYTSIR